MADSVCGLNPITCSVALVTFIGFLVSIISLVYHFDPIDQHLSVAQELDQLWGIFRTLEHNPNYVPVYYHEQLTVSSLEQDIQALMPHVMPTYNVCQRLKSWLYVWHMFRLSQRTKKAKIALWTYYTPRKGEEIPRAKNDRYFPMLESGGNRSSRHETGGEITIEYATLDKDLPSENASMRRNGTVHPDRRSSLPLERRDSWLSTPAQGAPLPKRVNMEHPMPKSSTVPNPYSESGSSFLSSPRRPAQAYHPPRRSEAVA